MDKLFGFTHFSLKILLACLLVINGLALTGNKTHAAADGIASRDPSSSLIYIPAVLKPGPLVPIINVPYFAGQTPNYHQAAVFWFGQVRGNENYADVRVGYDDTEIYVRVSVFDRYLWYDTSPIAANLTLWDAVTLYLDLDGNTNYALDGNTYRFVGQLNWWGPRDNYQAAYQGSSTGWNLVPLTFSTSSGWRGNAPNDTTEDRGYVLTFHLPFTSLGLSGPPSAGTRWGMAVALHDRDDAAGATRRDTFWPGNFEPLRSITWGQLSFGLSTYSPPPIAATQTITIRDGLNGATVADGVVGGNTLCGQGQDFWSEWGDHSYPAVRDMNVQNQNDIADWPCFSKIYLTFPLDGLPPGKVVISATLTLHQSGQSTGFPNEPPEAVNSLIQVFQVDKDWSVATLTWNNAPAALENVSQAWAGPITMANYGKSTIWDVSWVVARAYANRQPLRLAIYSADDYGPHGKYFLSSHVGSYESALMPSLMVVLGNR